MDIRALVPLQAVSRLMTPCILVIPDRLRNSRLSLENRIRVNTMKLGANSVLLGGYDLETAFKYLSASGYDGIELSAIDGSRSRLRSNGCRLNTT